MGRFLIKIKDKYFEWSTVVDAPITYGMTRDECVAYIKEEYGNQGLFGLNERLEKADECGSSSRYVSTLEGIEKYNRAGPKGACLTLNEIYNLHP